MFSIPIRPSIEETFRIDPLSPREASKEDRRADVEWLVEVFNANYQPMRIPRKELAKQVDRHLTEFLAEITGQRLETKLGRWFIAILFRDRDLGSGFWVK